MIVGVQPLAGFDKLLHYQVPEALQDSVRVGSLVRVPILNRLRTGLVLEVGSVADVPLARLKPIGGLLQDYPAQIGRAHV